MKAEWKGEEKRRKKERLKFWFPERALQCAYWRAMVCAADLRRGKEASHAEVPLLDYTPEDTGP